MSTADRILLTTVLFTLALAAFSPCTAAETGRIPIKSRGSALLSEGDPTGRGLLEAGSSGPKIVAYFDPGLTQRSTCITGYEPVTVYIVAEEFDFQVSALEYSLWASGMLQYDHDTVVAGTGSGTPDNMRIDFDPAVDASGKLLIQTVTYSVSTVCDSCTVGDYYISVSPYDAWDDGNNTRDLYISTKSYTCYSGPDFDIGVSGLSSPSSVLIWEDIAGLISASVVNNGASSTYANVFYVISSDTVITRGDYELSLESSVTLEPGIPQVVTCSATNIPLDAPQGDVYLGVLVQYSDDLDFSNNVDMVPIRIDPDPDIDTLCVYAEDFQDGPAGWYSKDLSEMDSESYWQQVTWNFDSVDYGVAWCGTDDPGLLATPPGYGNNWVQSITKQFTLPGGSPLFRWMVQYSVEDYYDFVYLEISTDGENFTQLESLTATSAGLEYREVDLTAYAGQTVTIRITVISDSTASDEDGMFPSDGACHVDWIEVSGYPVDDFETDLCGWEADVIPGLGGEYSLIYQPDLEPDRESMINTSTGEEMVVCNAWAAYEEATGDFPFTPVDYTGATGVNLAVASPAISVDGDAIAYMLQFDVYHDLPLNELIFYTWFVSSDGITWSNAGYIYYQEVGWTTDTYDISGLIAPGATTIYVRLVAQDMYPQWHDSYGFTGLHSVGPIFDNVKIFAIGSGQAVVDLSGFPEGCEVADADFDGIGDLYDLCLGFNPAPFDRDGDGCLDLGAGARHIEFLSQDTLKYYIHEGGAPGISDGSDIAAVRAGFDAWMTVPDLDIAVEYLGTTTQQDADHLDGVNMVTFTDPDYVFPPGVLGVGITTSYTEPTRVGGKYYREGEIIDCDIIFNPLMSFGTDTQGSGTDLQGVAVHEAGHLFGISHSSVRSSTMFYVLQPDTLARSLEAEDRLAFMKAYGDSAVMATATVLAGTVTNGETGMPVPGAIVFAMDAYSGDTLLCEYTLLDGTFEFRGLPESDYFVSIYPLNGTSPIGFIGPANINHIIKDNAETIFVPEYWDAAESSADDPSAMDAIAVSSGTPASAEFITNIDEDGPVVTVTSPLDEETGVRIDASILVSFSEPVDIGTLQGNFSLRDTASGDYIAGNAATLDDDTTLAFIPSETLEFSTVYRLELGTGFSDYFGNGLSSPFVMHFTTEEQPDVAMSSLAPRKGVEGALVVISGAGFDPEPSGNTVDFNGTEAVIDEASVNRLVVTVPAGAVTGNVTVTNITEGMTSNAITFTVLSGDEVAKGFDAGNTQLGGVPRSLRLTPDGQVALVATSAGYSAVMADPGSEQYLESEDNSIDGGLDRLDVTPGGRYAYAVSVENERLYRINADLEQGGLSGLTVLNEMDLGAEPAGVLIEPSGRRAFVAMRDGTVQLWDIDPGSATFDRQIGEIPSIGVSLRGRMATDPTGDILLIPSGSGKLYAYDMTGDSLAAEISVGLDPRDVAVDPTGERAYVTDGEGKVTIVSMSALQKIYDIATGGSLRGGAVTPAGSFLYAANRELNLCDVIDLRPESGTYRSVAADIPLPVNPVDVELSPDGLYAYSLSEQEERIVVTAIGVGPSLETMTPVAAPIGALLTLTGSALAADSTLGVLFTGVEVEPLSRTDSLITVTVPPGASSGPVTVIGRNPYRIDAPSNELHLELLGPTTAEAMRLAGQLASPGEAPRGAVSVPAAGGFAAVATSEAGGQTLRILDIDPASETFHQFIGDIVPGAGIEIDDIVVTPSGGHAVCIDRGAGGGGGGASLPVVSTNRLSDDFCTVTDSIDVSGLPLGVSEACISPGGYMIALAEYGEAGTTDCSLHLFTFDPVAGSAGVYLGKADLGPGEVTAVSFHPGGLYCCAAVSDPDGGGVYTVDVDPASDAFMTVTGTALLPPAPPRPVPVAMAFSADGQRAVLLADEAPALTARIAMILDSSDPSAPAVVHTQTVGGLSPGAGDVAFSPRGDRVIVAVEGEGLTHYQVASAPDTLVATAQTAGPASGAAALAYSPDAKRFYAASPSGSELLVYDFSLAGAIAKVSGDGQSAIVGTVLQAPLRVRVTTMGSVGVSGVPVTFEVTSGDGIFSGSGGASQTIVTDESGYAQAYWVLGPGTGIHAAEAAAAGLSGSPLYFSAEALVDPATLPLRLAYVVPVDATENVSLSTAVQAVFSKPVDIASAGSATFFLHEEGDVTPVPALIGSADGGRRLSLTPRAPLKTSTTYVIEMTAGILDLQGGALENPGSSSMVTMPPPPLNITSVNPPSGPRGVPVVISGTGFDTDPEGNIVLFGAEAGGVTESGEDFLDAVVPISAPAGPVSLTVSANEQVSNELPFTVLQTEAVAIDEDVISKVGTGSATRSVAMTPDGVRLYAVSPQANTVTCIDIFAYQTLAVIPVGENPYSITIHPDGKNAYVTNFLDNTVSVLDLDPLSGSFNEVSETVPVGINPLDAIGTPDGDRLIVSNIGSLDLSIMDIDESSETFNHVIATVTTGQSTRSMAVTPDGGLLYVCTSDGYLVVDVLDFGVVATVTTGQTTRTSAITPDGALLIMLTTEGEVLFFDIVAGSATENQVVGQVTTGGKAKSIAVTPDGAFLFLIPEVGDGIYVVELSYTTSAGVVLGEDYAGPGEITATIVDTFHTGEDPSEVAFAPNGTGATVVTNAGDNSISIFNPDAAPIAVHLTGFDVEQDGSSARLSWMTHLERGTIGFRLMRSEDGRPFEQVGPGLIDAKGPSEYVVADRSVRPDRRYLYRLEEVNELGTGEIFGPVEFFYVARFFVSQNVPNPFNPETKINFTLPEAGRVSLKIYDVAGREVRTLVDSRLPADYYTVTWDGRNNRGSAVASGIYFYRVVAGKNIATKKMVLLR